MLEVADNGSALFIQEFLISEKILQKRKKLQVPVDARDQT